MNDSVKKKKEEWRTVIKQVCPTMNEDSGIYFYLRIDEDGTKYAYIGKAKNLMERTLAHCMGYNQRIDVSIKKRLFYSENNPLGWKLNYLYCPEEALNEKEQYYINLYAKSGYTMYNVESGGTTGKTCIGERKEPKGYKDGLAQGYKNARRDVAKWFDKSLDVAIKGNATVNKQKAYERFLNFLKICEGEK